MKLEKAIEILGTYRDEGEADLAEDLDSALTLGIEALKKLQVIRGYPHNQWKQLLPGED